MFQIKLHTLFCIILMVSMSSPFVSIAQTVIKMELPKQTEKAFAVKTLFNEQLPTGDLVVLGALGYEIEGGATPYELAWYENNQLIAKGNIVAFKPQESAQYSLVVKDKNNCSKTLSINVDALKRAINDTQKPSNFVSLSPTLVKNHIMLRCHSEPIASVHLKFIDINRNIQFISEQGRSIAQELIFLIEAKIEKHKKEEMADDIFGKEDEEEGE
ncbi:MAG TPA: hypothetical protein PLD76_01310 [Paludibacteraceae bacterium]|nr:hypothetical protein [Paludibacteraceae bacterium]